MRRRLSVVITLAAVVLAGGLATATPALAAPAAPSLSGVATGTTNPLLAWGASSGAVRYSVDVATQSDFASTAIKYAATTANTAATPPTDLPVGSYWWRVRAADAKGAWGPYSTGTFSKNSAAVPQLATPANGTALQYPDDALILSWSPLAGAKSYEVQVDDDSGFVGAPAPVTTNNTSYTPGNPSFNTPTYWRVRAKSSSGVATNWSSVWSYSMTWPSTQKPILTSPADTANIEEVNLDWQPLVGASSYELQISPDQFFNAPIGGTRVVNSTAFSPSPTLPAGSYYWRVRGLSPVLNTARTPEPSQWSDVRTFTRAWPALGGMPIGTDPASGSTSAEVAAADGLKQVMLTSPADGDYSSMTEPTFSWMPQREAARYEIQFGTDVNFSAGTYSTCSTDHTTLTLYTRVVPFGTGSTGSFCLPGSPVKVTPGLVTYWRVRAIDEPAAAPIVYGVWSATRRTQYNPEAVVQSVDLSGTVPVLKWTAIDDISRFKVTIAPAPGNTNTKCTKVTAITYNTSYVPETLAVGCTGLLSWTVQAMEDDGDLSKQATQASWPTFTLNAPTPQASMGILQTLPGDGLRPPTLMWNALTGAGKYTVFFSESGANSYSPAHSSTTLPGFAYAGQGTTWPATLSPGTYDVFVQAFTAAGVYMTETAPISFTIQSQWPTVNLLGPCVPKPTTSQPQCVLHDTPRFTWEPQKNIGLYHVYVATDPNFTNVIRDWKTPFSSLTPVESLPDSQAGEAYYWYVRPCVQEGACGPFDPSVFPQAGAFRKVSLPVEALSPKASAQVPDEVTFTWKDYLATNFLLDGTNNESVRQEAESYQVQVSTTAEFTNIIETSPMIDQTTYTAQTTTYPEGPLYWRVRAFDNTGNPLTYSCGPVPTPPQPACSDFAFEKKSSSPVMVAPGSGAAVSSAPALSWRPMAYAQSYGVEIYRGTSVDPSALVTSLTTRGTAVIGTAALPRGTYGWRVRRVDVRSLPGRWTSEAALRTFVVGGNPVSLVLPSNGGKQADNRVVLQWQPTAGATRYKVQASLDSAFGTVLDSVTTDMTSWAPGMLGPQWPSGRIYWRVTSLDGAGGELTTSAVWSFTKGASAMTIIRYSGPERFSTAVAVSKGTFTTPGVPVVYVATGANFADALAGGPAAYRQGGPVLLVQTTSIPGVVATELTRLRPGRIVILGGTGAVSAAVAARLDAYTTGPVVRLAGSNRFDTARLVAAYAFGTSKKAYIANGTGYPDALAGAVSAAKFGLPLLLVTKDAVPSATRSAMSSLGVTSTTILGGTGVVSPATMAAVHGTTRLAGTDRFSTAVAISRATFATAGAVYLATGSNFPDSLSGTPSAAKRSAPLLLANGGCLTAATVGEIKRLGATRIYVLGGTGAVPESAARLSTC